MKNFQVLKSYENNNDQQKIIVIVESKILNKSQNICKYIFE